MISTHCYEEVHAFTGDKAMKGATLKRITYITFVEGGNELYVVRKIDAYDDDELIFYRANDRRKLPPTFDDDGDLENEYNFEQCHAFKYEEWLKFSRLPVEINAVIAIEKVIFHGNLITNVTLPKCKA